MRLPARHLTVLLATMLCWQAATAVESPPRQELRPFSAVYHLFLAGMMFGEVRVSLSVTPEDEYVYRAHTIPGDLIKLFREDEITEESRGKIVDGAIRPDLYLYRHKHSEKNRDATLKFDHEAGQVNNEIRGSHWTMSVPSGVQDKFSQQLALIHSVLNGAENPSFPVADGGKLKTYSYDRIEQGAIETPAGSFEAIALARRKGDRPSRMTIWLAPDLRFLPVKVEKRESGDRFTMVLQSVSWNP